MATLIVKAPAELSRSFFLSPPLSLSLARSLSSQPSLHEQAAHPADGELARRIEATDDFGLPRKSRPGYTPVSCRKTESLHNRPDDCVLARSCTPTCIHVAKMVSPSTTLLRSPQIRMIRSLSVALMCSTSHKIPASAGTNQGLENAVWLYVEGWRVWVGNSVGNSDSW